MNKYLSIVKNTQLAIKNSKSLIALANKILAKPTNTPAIIDDSWVEALCSWADKNNISEETLPRNREFG